jgi:outer membrane receptor protein involved in Fe transport
MKSLFVFTVLLLIPIAGWTQDADSQRATITGTIVDNNGEPLEAANVAIQDTSGEVITGGTSNQEGHFTIQVEPDHYVVKISFISYNSYQQKVDAKAGKNVDLGTVKLQPSSQKLGELVVRAKQSQMTMGFDKRIFNVGSDIASLGGSAVNVLQNVPSISVDINGDISLRGDNSVRILINGHPSRFAGGGIEALRSIPANLIKKIEVITNPSAKYSAEGTGGIINIILVKNRELGFNGSAAVNTGYPQNHGISTNLNYQKGNFNWFLNGGFNYHAYPQGGNSFQRFAGPDTTYMYRETTNQDRKSLDGNLRLGTDYYISKKQTFTVSTFMRLGKRSGNENINYIDLAYSPDAFKGNILDKKLRTNDDDSRRNNFNFNLRYKNLINGSKQKLTASARFGLSREPSSSGIKESVVQKSGGEAGIAPTHQRTGSQANRNRFRLNVEYQQPLGKKGKLEAGLRSNFHWNNNSQTVEELQNGAWVPITGYNGNFLYRENVNSAYLILGKKLGNFSGEVGLRAENTRIRTDVKKADEVNKQNYLNLFPSVFLNYAFNSKNSIQVSYSRRLRRPWSRMLLPYSDYSNSRSQRIGNPDLSPEFSNSFQGGYLRTWSSGSLLTSFYYRHRRGVIEHITKQKQGVLVRFPINLATEKAWGVEFSGNQDLFSGLSLSANVNLFQSNRNGQYQDQTFNSEGHRFMAKARLLWDLSAWHFQAAVRYRGPHETTQGRNEGFATLNTAISHDLFNGKARITLGVRDVLDSENFNNILTTNGIPNTDFYSQRNYHWSSRRFTLSFRYFFNSHSHNNPHASHHRYH